MSIERVSANSTKLKIYDTFGVGEHKYMCQVNGLKCENYANQKEYIHSGHNTNVTKCDIRNSKSAPYCL